MGRPFLHFLSYSWRSVKNHPRQADFDFSTTCCVFSIVVVAGWGWLCRARKHKRNGCCNRLRRRWTPNVRSRRVVLMSWSVIYRPCLYRYDEVWLLLLPFIQWTLVVETVAISHRSVVVLSRTGKNGTVLSDRALPCWLNPPAAPSMMMDGRTRSFNVVGISNTTPNGPRSGRYTLLDPLHSTPLQSSIASIIKKVKQILRARTMSLIRRPHTTMLEELCLAEHTVVRSSIQQRCCARR